MKTKKDMEIIQRIGNLALTKVQSYGKNREEYYEIVKFYPNHYFGKEHLYEKTEFGNYTLPGEPHCFIDASCFKNPESCYTIGVFEGQDDEEPDFRSVGSRIVVETEEISNLYALIRTFYINHLWEKTKRED